MDDNIRRLSDRVYRLEMELAFLKARLGIITASPEAAQQPTTRVGPEMGARAEQAAAAPPASQPALSAPVGSPVRPGDLEESIVGTWFPRVGAVAILIGAGFAFKYAVDQGLIGPGARVAIGVMAGSAFLGWGKWTDRRGWKRYSQAVTAGGIALLYLSILAAFHLYSLISGGTAFFTLVLVSVANAVLAHHYDAQPLAALAVFGAFINPFLLSPEPPENPAALYTYVALVDAGVVGLAWLKRWRGLEFGAFAGTWITFFAGLEGAGIATALGFATVFFLFFASVPFVRTRLAKMGVDSVDLGFLVPNTIIYLTAGLYILRSEEEVWRSLFALLLAAVHLAAGLLVPAQERLMKMSQLGLSVLLFTAWAPIQFDDFIVTTAWALKGVLIIGIGSRYSNGAAIKGGVAVLGLGFLGTLWMLGNRFDFEPAGAFLGTEALNALLVVGCLYAASWLLGRAERFETVQAGMIAGIAGSVLTVGWLSAEISVRFAPGFEETRQAYHFALSAGWGLYASGLLIAGVVLRLRWARLFSAGLLGLTVIKMAVVDLWTLQTGQRILAFTGLGLALLLTSLMYHRFKAFILGAGEGAGPP